jgi:hypothetical protein
MLVLLVAKTNIMYSTFDCDQNQIEIQRSYVHPDVRLSPAVSSQDFWEFMYRIERRKRLVLQHEQGLVCNPEEHCRECKVLAQINAISSKSPAPVKQATSSNDPIEKKEIKVEVEKNDEDFSEWNLCIEDVSEKSAVKSDIVISDLDESQLLAREKVQLEPLKMNEIDESDDAVAYEESWWKGHSFGDELSSRSHNELKQVI